MNVDHEWGDDGDTRTPRFWRRCPPRAHGRRRIDEIPGRAVAMRSWLATPVDHAGMEVLEIVGDGAATTPTPSIFPPPLPWSSRLAGRQVAKHGNRAASSQCGTADCPRPWAPTSRRILFSRRRLLSVQLASLHVRPEISFGHEICRRDPPRAGSDCVFLHILISSPTRQSRSISCWVSTTNIWWSRSPRSWIPWASVTPSSSMARTRWTRSPPPRPPRSASCGTAFTAPLRSRRKTSAWRAGPKKTWSAGHLPRTRRPPGDILASVERSPTPADLGPAQRAYAGLYAGGRRRINQRGRENGRRIIDSGKALAVLDAFIDASNRA